MKKIYFLIICIFIIILGTIGIKFKSTPEIKQEKNIDEIVEKQKKDSKKVEEKIKKTKVEEKQQDKVGDNKEQNTKTKENNSSSTNNITTKQSSSENKKSEAKTETNTNSNVVKKVEEQPITHSIEEKKEEPKKEEPKQEPKRYIGVPSPNTYNYSFHHGKIEYSTIDACVNDSYRIMEKDVVDIYGSWCSEVQDDNGTVLGAYLYIKCSSGNCDKYKD